MKTIATLLFTLCFCSSTFGQNWHPFVKNQTNYYKQQLPESELLNIETFRITEIETDSGTANYFQGSFIKTGCFNDPAFERILLEKYELLTLSEVFVYYMLKNNTIEFYDIYNQTSTFIFKPFINVGDSYLSNGLTIKCIEETVQDVFGTQDSVKIFSWDEKNKIILSKNHGFLKFSAPNGYFSTTDNGSSFELIGFSGNNGTKGYTIPDFSNFFNLNQGDVLYYENSNWYSEDYDGEQNNHIYYYKDSIIDVENTSDNIKYSIFREEFENNYALVKSGNFDMLYSRENDGQLISSQSSWFDIYQSNIGDELFYKTVNLEINDSDTITLINCDFRRLIYDVEFNIKIIADFPWGSVQLSNKEGFREKTFMYDDKFTNNWGKSKLIGSVINGVEKGKTIKTSAIIRATSSQLELFPNPTNNMLNIRKNADDIKTIEIFNLNGSLILKANTCNTIDVSILERGAYLVVIHDTSNKRFKQKFIKE